MRSREFEPRVGADGRIARAALRVPALPGGAVRRRHADRRRAGRSVAAARGARVPGLVPRRLSRRGSQPRTPCRRIRSASASIGLFETRACVSTTRAPAARAPGIRACTTRASTAACSRRARSGSASRTWTAGGTSTIARRHAVPPAATRHRPARARRRRGLGCVARARARTCRASARSFEVGERHYDLGNDLYRAMLGKRMVYSCGYWREAERPRRRAGSQARPGLPQARPAPGHARARHRLRLGRGAEVRGRALRRPAASASPCRASRPITRASCARACRSRSACRTTANVRRRASTAIFSLGMFEHVGVRNYDTYFEVARRCLATTRRTAGCSCCTRSAATTSVRPHRSVDRALHLPQLDAAFGRRRSPRAIEGPVRDRGLAQLRRRLRPHAAGLARQHRARLGSAAAALRRALPAHVAVLPRRRRWRRSARATSSCGSSCCRRDGVPGGYVAPR